MNCWIKKKYFERERETYAELEKRSLITVSYIYHVIELFCFVSPNVVILTAKENIIRCRLFSQLSKYKCTTLQVLDHSEEVVDLFFVFVFGSLSLFVSTDRN